MFCCSPIAEAGAPIGVVIVDPGSVTALALAGTGYVAGLQRWRAAAGRRVVSGWSVASFMLGLAVAGVAFASPLDTLEGRSLTAHMIQHVLLLSVAAPLLALGTPLPTLLWSLPGDARRHALAASRRLVHYHDAHFPAWVAAALVLAAATMWVWHIPDAYQAAVRHPGVHALEHASFLLTSTIAWWSIATARRSRRGAAAIAALIGSVPGMALGSAMVLAPRPWYPMYVHASVAAALSDQEIAGVVMWAFGGMAAVIAGAALFAAWLRSVESAGGDAAALVVPPVPVARSGR